jgi:hypothetical protein
MRALRGLEIGCKVNVPSDVRVINFNMPFMALGGLFVKIALASIQAALVLGSDETRLFVIHDKTRSMLSDSVRLAT